MAAETDFQCKSAGLPRQPAQAREAIDALRKIVRGVLQ